MENNEILSLFHHIHHEASGEHKVHHCGGEHVKINKKLNYSIEHCQCGLHRIDTEIAIGHATDSDLNPFEVKIKFLDKCPDGGWHLESGIKYEK
ncbi:MAG: hypothetical protein ACOCU8_01730 [Patescibacteria group bacterium]